MAATASFLSHLLLAPKRRPKTQPNPSHLPSQRITDRLPCRGRRSSVAVSAAASDLLSPAPSLKSRLAAGDTLYGLFLLSFSPTLAELAALAGYDYVVVDMEHGPGGIPEALACLRALDAARTPAVLRLPEASAVWAKKALDLGPAGLMLPAIESPEAAAEAVSHCRYPPRGVRGAAHPIVRASAYGFDDSYLSRCEDDTLVICQVETATAIAEIDAIAAVDGVDVVQMGPLDLSASMGYLWDPGNRKVRATLREAERKVLEAKKKKKAAAASGGNAAYLGGFAMQNDPPEQLKLRGYHMVAGAVDIAMFRKAALDDVRRFREAVMEIGEEDDEDEVEKCEKENDGYWSE
jgi:2-keto-3-deoxy-L-rhamnonate aldolase RhmA